MMNRTIRCPACGGEAPGEAAFCPQCGTPFAQPAATDPPVIEDWTLAAGANEVTAQMSLSSGESPPVTPRGPRVAVGGGDNRRRWTLLGVLLALLVILAGAMVVQARRGGLGALLVAPTTSSPTATTTITLRPTMT